MSKTVLLMNFGGPRNLDEVRDFVYQILRDPHTVKLPLYQPLQNIFAKLIAYKRSPTVKNQYKLIGGYSPLVESTNGIATAIVEKLDNPQINIIITQRFLRGWTANALAKLNEPKHLLLLPLFPQYSNTTTYSCIVQIKEQLEKLKLKPSLTVVHSYPDDHDYINALKEKILNIPVEYDKDTIVLCSAHGLPKSYITKGKDPYLNELGKTMRALRAALPQLNFALSFQSKVTPAEWTKPYTDDIIPELSNKYKKIVFVPISFVNEHIESLYEIGILYFNIARKNGLEPFLMPSIDTHPGFITCLTNKITHWNNNLSPKE